MLILLLAIIAILLVDKDSILFIKVAPPVPGGALFASAAERAYLVLGCLIGAAGGPLQAASRTLLIRMAPKDRIAQYFGLFALTGKVTSFIGPLLIGMVTAVTGKPEGGHGGAGAVFRGRTGAAGKGKRGVVLLPKKRAAAPAAKQAVITREKRVTQYAAASQFHNGRRWNTGSPG